MLTLQQCIALVTAIITAIYAKFEDDTASTVTALGMLSISESRWTVVLQHLARAKAAREGRTLDTLDDDVETIGEELRNLIKEHAPELDEFIEYGSVIGTFIKQFIGQEMALNPHRTYAVHQCGDEKCPVNGEVQETTESVLANPHTAKRRDFLAEL